MSALRARLQRRRDGAAAHLIAAKPQPTRAALEKEFYRRIGWFKPDGGLKNMMAKVTMLAMHRDGVIELPPPGSSPRTMASSGAPRTARKNLPLVVDNPRFLILPRVEIPNLGSHILVIVRRRLPADWTERYNTAFVLIETFVETPRYAGAVYNTSGWTRVGIT